jgi:hypothetical protein
LANIGSQSVCGHQTRGVACNHLRIPLTLGFCIYIKEFFSRNVRHVCFIELTISQFG